ncbi:hypothetical protein BDQ17DRAFT_1072968 [Cyathus striatus]|nr:hypothetical protein BDQ17DRAFT_1072968 [Cyathus striatus]
MSHQRSDGPNRLNQSRQRESVPPLYVAPDALTVDIDANIERGGLPPAYSTVAGEVHNTEDADSAPAEPLRGKAKESHTILRHSPVFDTEAESRMARPLRGKANKIYYPTPRYSCVFDSEESRLAGPSREKANRIYYPTPRYSPVFDDGNTANPDSEEAESRPAEPLITKAGASFPTPRYSTVFDDEDAEISQVEPEQQAPLVTHEFHMKSGGKSSQSWATLRLFSQAASEQKVPRFHGGQVSGFIDVMPESAGVPSVHAVTLMLRGKMISSLQGNYSLDLRSSTNNL